MKYPKRVTIIELEHSGHAGRVTLPAFGHAGRVTLPAFGHAGRVTLPASPAKMYQKRFAHMKREVKDNVERMLAGENVLAGWILAPKTRECRGNAIGQRLVAQLPWGHNIERKAS